MLWGIIDEAGKWIVKPKYGYLDEFNERGYAEFEPDDSQPHPPKRGLLNDRGEELFVKVAGVLRVEEHCDLVRAYYPTANAPYDFAGNPIPLLSGNTVEWTGKFSKAQLAIACSKGRWGRVSASGEFKPWPAEVLEPYVDHWDHESQTIINADGPKGDLVPVVLQDRRMGYVNSQNELAFVCDITKSPDGDTLIFKSADDNELWRHKFDKETKLPKQTSAFFQAGDLETGFEADYLTNIQKSVGELTASEPNWFEISCTTRETYQAHEVDEDDRDGAMFGAVLILGSHYVSEANVAEYGSFLLDADHGFQSHREAILKQLSEKLGEPIQFAEEGDARRRELRSLQHFAMDYDRYWDLGNGYLGLLHYADSGDGDFGSNLSLIYLPKKRP